jgi:hypothetical protein
MPKNIKKETNYKWLYDYHISVLFFIIEMVVIKSILNSELWLIYKNYFEKICLSEYDVQN